MKRICWDTGSRYREKVALPPAHRRCGRQASFAESARRVKLVADVSADDMILGISAAQTAAHFCRAVKSPVTILWKRACGRVRI